MSQLFHRIDGAVCVLRSKGLYRQVDVYHWRGAVYVKYDSGFIGLRNVENGTTLPNVRWEHLEGVETKIGRLGIIEVA